MDFICCVKSREQKYAFIFRRSKTASLSSYGITVYQFTEHYITNANTVPGLILSFLYDIAGRDIEALWPTDKTPCGLWLVAATYLLS